MTELVTTSFSTTRFFVAHLHDARWIRLLTSDTYYTVTNGPALLNVLGDAGFPTNMLFVESRDK